MNLYYTRDNCRLCGSKDLELALPLAPMPIATPNFAVPNADRSHRVFQEAVPLELHLCRSCGLLQVLHVGNPEVQYTDYIYTTSLSLGLAGHFKTYVDELIGGLAPAPKSFVVEIGSNDGTLLRHFKEAGFKVLGVDPARAIARRATENGVDTLGEFFTAKLANGIRADKGRAAIIIANNVIANIDNLDDMVEGVRDLLAEDGVFVFETQYGADVVEKNLLDTVYHEHLSYFNIKPLALHFARHGMVVFDVERIWTKGGSIRVFVQQAKGPRPTKPIVEQLIRDETSAGHYGQPLYRRWADEIAQIRLELAQIVADQRKAGRLVGGYGVSVGTTTLLPQFEMTDKIDVLFDDDPNKNPDLTGPGYSIPVLPTAAVYEKNPGAIIIFAWRYAEPIMARHQRFIAAGGKFVVPLPRVVSY